jgi:hypothetical protein
MTMSDQLLLWILAHVHTTAAASSSKYHDLKRESNQINTTAALPCDCVPAPKLHLARNENPSNE